MMSKFIKLNQLNGNQRYSKGISSHYFYLTLESLLLGGILFLILLANIGLLRLPIQLLVGLIFAVVGLSLFFQWSSGHSPLWNTRNFIFLGVLFWVLLDPLRMREGIDEFSYDIAVETLLYVGIFMAMVCLGYSFPPCRAVGWAFSKIQEPRNSRQVFWSIVVVYLIGISPILYYSQGSVSLFWKVLLAGYSPTGDPYWRRVALGGSREFLISFVRFFFLAAPFLTTWALKKIAISRCQKMILLFMVISILIILFFEGVRFIFGFVVMGLFLYLYAAMSPTKRRRWLILVLLGIAMSLWLMQVMVTYRAIGFYAIDIGAVDARLTHFHTDNNFYWLATAVKVMPEQFSFTNKWPFLYIFIHPIPRFLWPEKPASEGFPFITWDERGGETLTSSIIGDFYMAQGILGVIVVGLVYGWIARNWDQIVRMASGGNIHTLIYYVGVMLIFLGGRTFDTFVTQWYVGILIIAFAYYLGRKEGKRYIIHK